MHCITSFGRTLANRAVGAAIAIIAIVALSLASGASAQRIELARARTGPRATPIPKILSLPPGIRIPTYAPGPMPFHEDERLTFVASWLGLPAAQAQLWLHRDPADPALWTCEAALKTNHAVDVFFKMRDYMREQFRSGSFAPRDMYVRQRENYRHDDFNVWFDRDRQLVTMSKRNSHGVQLKQYRASNPWGMLSGAAMALSQPMAVGEKYTFDVFSATTRYVLRFEVTGRERIATPLGTIDALRLVPSVLYLSNGKFRADAQSTTIWVSADGRKLPLRVESATFIGEVRIDLVKVEQRPQTAAHRAELLR